jgi:hypothetical protein
MIQDSQGKTWTRSDDRLELICEDGRKVLGNAEMTDEYLLSVSEYVPEPVAPEKTEADRIAELEAQVKALLAKLS